MRRGRRRAFTAVVACGMALLGAAPAAAEQYVKDGSFEAGAPDNPNWAHTSAVNLSPLCNASCGDGDATAGPRTGSTWSWFGGTDSPQTQSLSQQVGLPADQHAALSFWLWSGLYAAPATLTAKLDGATLFQLDSQSQSRFAGSYHQVIVPVGRVSAGTHTLRFDYESPGGGGASTNVSLDDVAFEALPAPALPTVPVVPAVPSTPPPNAKIAQVTYTAKTGKGGKFKRASASYKAKQGKTGSAKMRFVGEGGEGELRFECSVDSSGFKPCVSPVTFRSMTPGSHHFEVRAIDSTGRIDLTPAKLTQVLKYSAKQGKTGSAKK